VDALSSSNVDKRIIPTPIVRTSNDLGGEVSQRSGPPEPPSWRTLLLVLLKRAQSDKDAFRRTIVMILVIVMPILLAAVTVTVMLHAEWGTALPVLPSVTLTGLAAGLVIHLRRRQ
jgi:hypothetical protein